jgi:hypothetical protein
LLVMGALVTTACGDDEPTNVVTPPGAPSGVTAQVTGGTSVIVAWTPGSGATSQEVSITAQGGSPVTQSFSNNTTAVAQFDGLTPGTSYAVQVTAINTAGRTGSQAVVVTIPGGGGLPGQPTNVSTTVLSPTSFEVTWTPGSGATSQRVDLSADGSVVQTEDIASNTTTSTTFDGLTTGVEYTIVVTAINSEGETASNPLTVTLSNSQVVSGTINDDVTWVSDVVYILDGPVFVGSDCGGDPANPTGTCNAVTLTIEPGTTITAKREPSDSNVRSSFLIVTRGSRIIADATGASGVRPSESQMIVFTSDAPRGMRARGDWGGLVLNGRANINNEDGGGGEASGEGDSGLYGGIDDTDSSGVLRGVRVEFAGDDVTASDQLNGIALQGTGSGTTVEFVQVHYNVDDGTEPFGGSTTQTHMVVTGIGDDSFDGTDGYRGFIQYAIAQQRSDEADNGFELSNNGDNPTYTPKSTAVIANATMVGASQGQVDVGGTESDIGLLHREGSSWRVYNTIITNFNDSGFCLEDAVVQSYADAAVAGNRNPGEFVAFFNSILWANVNRTDDSDVNFADTCNDTGFEYDMQAYFETPGFDNLVADPQLDPTHTDIGSLSAPPSFVPAAMPGGYVPFDVSTLNSEGGAGIILPTDGRTLEATDYAGAVAPGDTDPWYVGWTVWSTDGTDSRPNADGQ